MRIDQVDDDVPHGRRRPVQATSSPPFAEPGAELTFGPDGSQTRDEIERQ